MSAITESVTHLTTGAEYIESLRDGREVWYRGERVEDVTTHPVTGPGIAWNAEIYDDQHDPAHRDTLSFVRDDGARVATGWLAPRVPDDLRRRRECAEHMAWRTFALMGRQPDMLPWTQIGLNGAYEAFKQASPEFADNLWTYLQHAQENNVHLAAVIIEPQGMRSRSAKAGDDRSGVLRAVREDDSGIWITGARAVGSLSAQANELLVGSIYYPHVRPDESFWATIPIGSPGLKLILRDAISDPTQSLYDHPIVARGEETDAFVIFDEVFVPRERIFSYRAPELHDPALFSEISRGEHWHVLNRLTVKAEIFAGLAQMIADVLEIRDIPVIRDQIGRIASYAQVLRAGTIASEVQASLTDSGLLLPDGAMVAAVRSFGLDEYPNIVHIVQELCGQGLVMRFSEKDFDHPELKEKLAFYLDQRNILAKDKNLLMNFVYDYTTSSHAGRAALFENVNALPAFILRQKVYNEFDRSPFVAKIAAALGIEPTS
jgi:4-hydroxyphenylacetate 3-monooxygenase